jgi:hypothetical protein
LGIIDYDDPLLMLFVFLERFRFSGLKNAVQIDIQHPLTMLDEVGFPLKELPYIIWSLKKKSNTVPKQHVYWGMGLCYKNHVRNIYPYHHLLQVRSHCA